MPSVLRSKASLQHSLAYCSNAMQKDDYIDVEAALKMAGDCGLYHLWLMALSALPSVMVAANVVASIFNDMVPGYQCDVDYGDWLNRTCNFSTTARAQDTKLSNLTFDGNPECYRYDFATNSTAGCALWLDQVFNNISSPTESEMKQCDRWIYDQSVMRETTATEFSLVCGNTWAGYLSQSSFMFGVLLGNLVIGWIADRLGRRHAFLLCSMGALVSGVTTSYTQTYATYLLMRCVVGFFVYAAFPVLFILVSEMIVARRRAAFAQFSQVYFGVGFMLLSLMAYCTRHWRSLQRWLSIPYAASLVLWWYLPESPRWLMANRKPHKAQEVVKNVARINALPRGCTKANGSEEEGIDGIDSALTGPESDEGETESSPQVLASARVASKAARFTHVDMYRRKKLRSVSLVMSFQWFSVSCIYYGLTLNAAQLGGDPFLNLFCNGLAEATASVLVIPILNRVGRPLSSSVSQIAAGAFSFLLFKIPYDVSWLLISCSLVGKFAAAVSFGVMYLHVGELYPTQIRSVAMGVCNAWARVGGIACPLIAMTGLFVPSLPYAIFAGVSVLSGVLVLTLPETTDCPLLETIEEGEEFIANNRGPLYVFVARLCGTKSATTAGAPKQGKCGRAAERS